MRKFALLVIVVLVSALVALADGPVTQPDKTPTTLELGIGAKSGFPRPTSITELREENASKVAFWKDPKSLATVRQLAQRLYAEHAIANPDSGQWGPAPQPSWLTMTYGLKSTEGRWPFEVGKAEAAWMPGYTYWADTEHTVFLLVQRGQPGNWIVSTGTTVREKIQTVYQDRDRIVYQPAPPDTRIILMPPATVNLAAPITLPAPKLSLVVLPAINIVLAGGNGGGETPLRGTAASRAQRSWTERSSMAIGSVGIISLPDRKQPEHPHKPKPKPGDECDDDENKPHEPPPGDGGGDDDDHHPPPSGDDDCTNSDTNGDGIVDSHDDVWPDDGGHLPWDDPGNPTNEGAGWTEDTNTPPPPADHGTSGGGNEPPPSGAY